MQTPLPEMAPLHVLALSRALPFHSIGGMQAIAWDLLRAIAQLGHRVTVITTAVANRPGRFASDGVEVVPVPQAPPEQYGRAWWSGSDAEALAIHRRHPVDAVLSISVAAAELPRFRAEAASVPFFLQAHGTSWGELESKWRSGRPLQWLKSVKNLYWLFKEPRIYRRFDEIIMVGDVLEEQYHQWPMPWVAGRVPRTLIRNGVDTDRFNPGRSAGAAVRQQLKIPAEARVIIFVARLHPQKGAKQLLSAFEILASEDSSAHLLLVGGGEDERALRQQASTGVGSDRIVFTGAVARESIASYLSCADAFAFPSLRVEVGLAMNVIEALACGLPCVISESMRSSFARSKALLYAEPDNAPELAAALRQALSAGRSESSQLDPSYTLSVCARAYVERLAARSRAR